jgi:uncharacterized protein YcnI
MSMSTRVVGFRPPDEEWQRHKAVWDACQFAGVRVPDETNRFFMGTTPDPAGIEVELTRVSSRSGWVANEYKGDMEEGYEVMVAEIPEGVTRIRFVNSW